MNFGLIMLVIQIIQGVLLCSRGLVAKLTLIHRAAVTLKHTHTINGTTKTSAGTTGPIQKTVQTRGFISMETQQPKERIQKPSIKQAGGNSLLAVKEAHMQVNGKMMPKRRNLPYGKRLYLKKLSGNQPPELRQHNLSG